MMEDILYDCGNAKRTDFRLKTRYYGIKTKIYLVEKRHYIIQLLNYLDVFDVIREDFNDNIRSLGDWIDLTSQKPEKILAIVEPISDIVCNNEGVFLTREMFQSLLISRFPKVNFVKIQIEHEDGPNVIISVSKDTKDADIEAIGKFVRELKNGLKTITVKRDSLVGEPLCNHNIELACTDKSFPFSIRDSEFWFDNVEKIYSGKIGKESLRFFDGSKTKCYMDFSVWNNDNINIRSNALLYDTIFMSFPLEDHVEDFLQQQHLKVDDLEEMVARNKLVILLPNTENRYDKKIVDRLYQINHDAVVSKRGINALMAMFYCELEERFLAYWQGNEQFFEVLCRESIERSDEKMKLIYERLVWPIKVMRESYELLTNYGPMKLASIGVNRLFEGMWQGENKNDNNIQFELTVNSNAIHVASALQATYFPFANREEGGIYSDVTPSNILGDIINTYQYPYDEQRHNIMEYGRMLDRERESIYLLKSDNSVSLKNMLNYAEKYSTATTLKKILMNLSGLDVGQRNDKIAEYNNLIAEIGEEKIKDKLFSYVLTAAGIIPIIGNITSFIEPTIQLCKDLGLGRKHKIKKIEAGTATKDDEVYILDKLSRVAKISID